MDFTIIPLTEYLSRGGGRKALWQRVQERWPHIYSPEVSTPADMICMLADLPDCWAGLRGHDLRAVVWFCHEGHELFPNLHILLLKGLFREAWNHLMSLMFYEKQFRGFYICGYEGQSIHYWLERLPYGTLYRLPAARIDPRTLEITGWWEFICHYSEFEASERMAHDSSVLCSNSD